MFSFAHLGPSLAHLLFRRLASRLWFWVPKVCGCLDLFVSGGSIVGRCVSFWARTRCRVGSGMRLEQFEVRERKRSVSC